MSTGGRSGARAAGSARLRFMVILSTCLLSLLCSVASAGATGSSVTTATNWPKYRFDLGNTGYNPHETILGPSNVGSLVEAWASFVGSGTPAVVNGVLYVEWGGANVSALKASTGAGLWTTSIGSSVCCGGNLNSPAVMKGVVYAGLSGGLYALKASSGAIRWKFAGAFGSNSAAVADRVVYAGAADGNLYALKASNGTELWSFSTGGSGSVSSSAAVVNGVVYVGGNDGNVYALNASTGSTLWSFPTGTGALGSSPAVVNGVVYVGGSDNKVYALNASTGGDLWSYQTGGGSVSSPAVANGVVYVGQQDVGGPGGLEALNASTGAVLWSIPSGDFAHPPIVANGVVYVAESNSRTAYAYNGATGAQLWSPGTYLSGSPVVVNGVLYFGNTGISGVYAFRLP